MKEICFLLSVKHIRSVGESNLIVAVSHFIKLFHSIIELGLLYERLGLCRDVRNDYAFNAKHICCFPGALFVMIRSHSTSTVQTN